MIRADVNTGQTGCMDEFSLRSVAREAWPI